MNIFQCRSGHYTATDEVPQSCPECGSRIQQVSLEEVVVQVINQLAWMREQIETEVPEDDRLREWPELARKTGPFAGIKNLLNRLDHMTGADKL